MIGTVASGIKSRTSFSRAVLAQTAADAEDQNELESVDGTFPVGRRELGCKKSTSRTVRQTSSGSALHCQSQNSTDKLNNQVVPRIARRCADVDTLRPRERQSIHASPAFGAAACQPRHPVAPHPDFHPLDSRLEPGSPALERFPVVSVVHVAGARAPTGDTTPRGSEARDTRRFR